MDIDPLSAIAPARVKALLIPLGHIRQSRFLSFVERFRRENVVRLGDVNPDGSPHRTMFSPHAFPAGRVLFDFVTSRPSTSQLALTPFEVYREPLIVIALTDGSTVEPSLELKYESDTMGRIPETRGSTPTDLSELLSLGLEKLHVDYPRALVTRIFVFDRDMLDEMIPSEVIAVPSPEKSPAITMKTVICDLTSSLLAEMTTYAKSLQALPYLESPKNIQTLATVNSLDQVRDARNGSYPEYLRSSSPTGSARLYPSHEEQASSVSRQKPSNTTFDSDSQTPNLTGTPISPPNGVSTPSDAFDGVGMASVAAEITQATNNTVNGTANQEKVSMQGFGAGSVGEKERNKGQGRIGVALGSLYLLAGRWPDALRELTESATIAMANNDHLWHAKALDNILVSLLMIAWAGMDFRIPQILHSNFEKPNSSIIKISGHTPPINLRDLTTTGSFSSNNSVSLQNLTRILPQLVHHILHLYIQAWTFTKDKPSQLSFSDSVIRFTRLLVIMSQSQWILDEASLRRIVLNVERPREHVLLAEKNLYPSQSELASLLFRAFPSSSSNDIDLVTDKILILSGIASVLSELGYHRKKALILREILSTLLPAFLKARKDDAAEIGLHPAASLVSLNNTPEANPFENPDQDIGSLACGVRSFLALLCKAYGISVYGSASNFIRLDSKAHEIVPTTTSEYDAPEAIALSLAEESSRKTYGDQQLKLDVLRSCINACEALADLDGVLLFSTQMLRTASSGIAPGPDGSEGPSILSVEEQIKLSNSISRTISTAHQLGFQYAGAEYWDEFLVRQIEFVENSTLKNPTQRVKAMMDESITTDSIHERNPFIYDPYRKSAPTSPTSVMITQEEALFKVTLQNLQDFEVEVQHIQLITNGPSFKCSPLSTVIGPYRSQTLPLTGTAMEAGSLSISGCRIKIKGCRERDFPIFAAPWKPNPIVKVGRPREYSSNTVIQRPASGSSDISKTKRSRMLPIPTTEMLNLNVIKAQPTLAVKSISLQQSATMLLEGETKYITLVLQNISPVPVNFLTPSFSDSATSQLQIAMTRLDISPLELYELEFASLYRQSIRWERENHEKDMNIEPGKDISLRMSIFGNPGLSHGNIQVDYGHLNKSKLDTNSHYTRQLNIPLAITVNASIELVRNDILPFTPNFAWQNQQRQRLFTSHSPNLHHFRHTSTSISPPQNLNCFQSLLDRIGFPPHSEPHCLLLLDLRNSWPTPLTVSIQVRLPALLAKDLESSSSPVQGPWQRAYTVHEPLQPGHTSRILLLVPRIYIAEPQAPIPLLDSASKKRQFIIGSRPKSDPNVELATLETFHYREELLGNYICATWEEDSSHRSGLINLRALNLTSRMVSTLKLDDLEISFSISNIDTSSSRLPSDLHPVTQLAHSTYLISTTTFLTLIIRLQNRSSQTIYPLLRLQPSIVNHSHASTLDLNKRVIWNGLLQRMLPALVAKESRTEELAFCITHPGVYEWGGSVEEVKPMVQKNRREEPGRRRTWWARQSCVVIAKDRDDLEKTET